jgi:hypothetical protein
VGRGRGDVAYGAKEAGAQAQRAGEKTIDKAK